MHRVVITATFTIAALAIAGCKSEQQVQQEDLARLQAKYNTMMNQYASDCSGLGLDRNNAPRVAKCNEEEARMKPIEQQIKALSEKIAAH
jgi:hypothetical protein